MQREPPSSLSPEPFVRWFEHHPAVFAVLAVAEVCVSLLLIGQMWTHHRKDSLGKKVVWTFILLIPFAGWIAYGGLFHPPGYSDTPGWTSDWYSQ